MSARRLNCDQDNYHSLTLGTFIRMRRIALGLSQEQLAERMSDIVHYVRQSEISRLELDKVTLPRRDRLVALGRALNVPVGVLLALSGWGNQESSRTERLRRNTESDNQAESPVDGSSRDINIYIPDEDQGTQQSNGSRTA
jgi:transcriptional regulator with XRE-family HTH domain